MLGRGEIFEAYKYVGRGADSYDAWLKFRQ